MLFARLGCQTAKKPASNVLPAHQTAPPPIQQAAASKAPANKAQAAAPAPIPAKAAGPQPQSKADPVAELIDKVEKEYQAGLNVYNAGQKADAKTHFDRAFNL